MCFSATASFTASALLFALAAYTGRKAYGTRYEFLGLFPFLFGLQQGLEGVVWLSTSGVVASAMGLTAAYGFLVFAVALWPLFGALAAWMVELDEDRRRWMCVAVGLGAAWALAAVLVLVFSDVSFSAVGGHLTYDIVDPEPWFVSVGLALYTGIGIFPYFVSSEKQLTVLGGVLFISGFISWVVAEQWFTSIWCFAAAVISSYIAVIVYRSSRL